MPNEPLRVRYELVLEDIHAFNLFHAHHAPVSVRSRRNVRFALSLLLFALLLSLGLWIRAPMLFWLTGLVILAAWYALFPSRMDQMTRRHTERTYSTGRNEGVLGPFELVLEPDWLVERSELREVRTRWRAVENVVSTQAHLFLYISGFSAIICPKRAFASPQEFELFAARARELCAGSPAPGGASRS